MHGKQIRALRNAYKFSRANFSKLFDVSEQTVRNWELEDYKATGFYLVVLIRLWQMLNDDDKIEHAESVLKKALAMKPYPKSGDSSCNLKEYGVPMILFEIFGKDGDE